MPEARALTLYIGAYTQPLPHVNGRGLGIYRGRLNPDTGALTIDEVAASLDNPTFLALDRARRRLYAAGEVAEMAGEPGGAVHAFAIDADAGRLAPLNRQSTAGAATCHIAVEPGGRCVLTANYAGSVSVLPIADDGRVAPLTQLIRHAGAGPDPARQEGPHPHGVYLDRTGRYVLVPDLGADRIFVYRFAARQGTLAPHDPPWAAAHPGAGPRHLALHPGGRWLYCVNELDATLSQWTFDAAAGVLTELGWTALLPAGASGSGAEVAVGPDGRFVYASVRGHDSIAIFAVAADGGEPVLVGHEPTQGRTPRHFALSPDGRLLIVANQDSDSLVTFNVDAKTGKLTPTGQGAAVPSPACVLIADRDTYSF